MSSRYLKCSIVESNSWLSTPLSILISVITNTIQPVASVKSKHPLYFFPQSPSPAHHQDRATLPSAHIPNATTFHLCHSYRLLCCHRLGLDDCNHFLTGFSAVILPTAPTRQLVFQHYGPLFHSIELRPQRSCQASSLLGIWHLQLVPALDMPNCAFNPNSSSSENDQQISVISSERHPRLTNLKLSPSPFYHMILLHLTI